MAKNTKYFSHDIGARNDDKIICLCDKFGGIAYAAYWVIIEKLHTEENNKISLKTYTLSSISKFLQIDVETLRKIIEYAINDCDLFHTDNEYIWSERVLKNVEKYDEIVKGKIRGGEASAAARAKKEAEKRLLNESTQFNRCSTDVQQNSTRVEHNLTELNTAQQTKLNEIKLNDNLIINKKENQVKEKADLLFYAFRDQVLENDLQSFIDEFKGVHIGRSGIERALNDYCLNLETTDETKLPRKYTIFRQWFKDFLKLHRSEYVTEQKSRVVYLDPSFSREQLHDLFDFYWSALYTKEEIVAKIMSGEYPIRKDRPLVGTNITLGKIKIEND